MDKKVQTVKQIELRDWFAAHAINVMIHENIDIHETSANFHAAVAKGCYMLADALIKERNKE